MNNPKDYQEPQEVRDYAAENGIKWNAIAQGLILASIIGVFAFGVSFAGNVLNKFDKVNGTLTEIRDLISAVNTKAEVNASKIEDNKDSINRNTQAIYQIRGNNEN